MSAVARSRDGCEIHFVASDPAVGALAPVLLINGFASTLDRNWVSTGWFDAIAKTGRRVIAYDQRGHGRSRKRYDPADYAPDLLVADALAVLEAAGAETAVVMGYSLGARVAREGGLTHPERVRALILSGIGGSFRDFGGARGDREIVAQALESDEPWKFPASARFYRKLADQTHGDCRALAPSGRRPIRPESQGELARIAVPTLVVVGDRDPVAGDPMPLVSAIPGARLVRLAGKDHMKAVGAKEHRSAVVELLRAHPV